MWQRDFGTLPLFQQYLGRASRLACGLSCGEVVHRTEHSTRERHGTTRPLRLAADSAVWMSACTRTARRRDVHRLPRPNRTRHGRAGRCGGMGMSVSERDTGGAPNMECRNSPSSGS